MKQIIFALFALTFAGTAYGGENIEIKDLSKSLCLREAATVLEDYLSNEDGAFEAVLDDKGLPVALDAKDYATYELFGVWLTSEGYEFVQYGDKRTVVMATMDYNEDKKTCTVVEVDSGQNDWD